MLKEKLYELFTNMDDNEIVSVWNEYCYATNRYDDEIFSCDTMEEMIENSNESGLYWVNRFFYGYDEYNENGSANPNRNFFTFNGYGNIISFDYIYNQYKDEFYNIDVDDLIDYIIENKESFGNNDIQNILDSAAETEEEDE